MEWISVNNQLPPALDKDKDCSIYVLVTNGKVIEFAQFIFRPRNYGCAVDDDEMEATCGPQPHWHFTREGVYKEGDRCIAYIETHEVTHWMSLPELPKDK